MQKKLLLLLCLFSVLLSINELEAQHRCGTDHYMENLLKDPDFAEKFYKQREEIRVSAMQKAMMPCTNPLIIPVAVHYGNSVTTANTACLVTAAQEQINQMNLDFSSCNANAGDLCSWIDAGCTNFGGTAGADAMPIDGACIQFCLADQNLPAGEDNIGGFGITVGDYTWSGSNADTGNNWDGYLNIFVGTYIAGGTLGVAPLNGGANPSGNGVYVLASTFGAAGWSGCSSGTGIGTDGTFSGGATCTHEVGHYFGLEHTFSDSVADTPPQSSANAGCPTVNTTTCTSTVGTDYSANFMDYVDDNCMSNFSADQVAIMQSTAAAQNVWTTNSISCFTNWQNGTNTYASCVSGPCGNVNPPVTAFSPNSGSITVCTGDQITVTDQSTNNPDTWAWIVGGTSNPSITSSSSQNITFTVANSGTITLQLIASNSNGTGTTANGTINVTVNPNCISGCGTVTNVGATDNLTLYNDPNGGYVCGSNSYGDESKVDRFDLADFGVCYPSTITSFQICSQIDAGSSGNITAYILDEAGGLPNAILGSSVQPIADFDLIDRDNDGSITTADCTIIDFSSSPVVVNGPFYCGITGLTGITGEIGIYSNTDPESTPPTAYEEFGGGGGWFPFDDASSWGLNISMLIVPTILPDAPNVAITLPTGTLCDDGTSYTFTENATLCTAGSGTAEIYLWDVRDSGGTSVATGTNASENFSFSASGSYDVELCVTGLTCETNCTTQTITVTSCGTSCPPDYDGANAISGIETGTGGVGSDGDYETDGVITSTQDITSGVIDYDSAIEINLNAGFCVQIGAEFNAFIDGCNGTGGGVNPIVGNNENTSFRVSTSSNSIKKSSLFVGKRELSNTFNAPASPKK